MNRESEQNQYDGAGRTARNRRVAMRHTSQLVAGVFGRVAASYDQAGFLTQIARRLVAQAGVRPRMQVLDVACGTGAALVEVARRVGPDGLVVGIDLAEPMVAHVAGGCVRLNLAMARRRLPSWPPGSSACGRSRSTWCAWRPRSICCTSKPRCSGPCETCCGHVDDWRSPTSPRVRAARSARGHEVSRSRHGPSVLERRVLCLSRSVAYPLMIRPKGVAEGSGRAEV
jgi:Methyltransferase domain